MKAARAAVALCLAAWLMVTMTGETMAAQLVLFSANGVKTVVGDLVPQFEKASGNSVSVVLGEAGELRRRILEGEACDVAFLPSAVLAELVTQGKMAPGSAVDVARTDVGIAVSSAAPRPDTSSADALRRLMLAARTIVITDPASGGVSGVHIADVLRRLGIADDVKAKLKLTRGVLNAELVARGEADLAIQLAHEIRAVPGVEFVALPAEFQRGITFSVGVVAGTRDGDSAKALADLLSGPAAAAAVKAKGMEPAAGR
jgi:molybdate transport system substrate-binding protein